MGTLTSGLNAVLPTLQTAVGVASGLSGLVKSVKNEDTSLRQLQAQQAERLRQSQEDASLQKAQILASAEDAERKRKDALKRAVARQRTNFGAQGISTSGGSGQAILLGLFDESEDEKFERDRLDSLKTNALDQNLSQQKRLNVLQASQLAEKQRFSSLF